MKETEFLILIDTTLNVIESTLENATIHTILDIDCNRHGNVLDIECINYNTKIIINSQISTQELWVATKINGYHYRYDGIQWINIRDNSELFETLSIFLSEQTGVMINLNTLKLHYTQ